MSREAALVKSANFLSGVDETLSNLKQYGPGFYNNFHASPGEILERDIRLLEVLKKYHFNKLLPKIQKILKLLKDRQKPQGK